MIISDSLFYDRSAMTAAQIQTFLDGKIGSCLTDRCLNVAVLPVASRPASYSIDTGGLVCSAIAGGNLRVSELIYRTQVACNISAKVILVTLQKEQGLVTSRAPSDWALRAAMGMGCPDTAPCDDAFAGLATQIMSGARQLHVYKVGGFGRQPGAQYVQYHPNAGCGGTTVNVRNYATAALYNYTPYQPNAAALANLGGTGDSCSSYGNRNFWRFYNDWFGSSIDYPCTTNSARDVSAYWQQQGGSGGPLGAPVSPGIIVGAGGMTVGSYAGGNVYCTPRLGPVAVVGDINTKYLAMGSGASILGGPLSARITFSAGGISGYLQEFQRGTMLSSTTTGTHAVLHGAMRDAWGSRGGSGGSLGWPTGDQQSTDDSVRQQFQNGLMVIPTSGGAVVLGGDIAAYWAVGSRPSVLGTPTSNASTWTAGGVTGKLQYFARGMVLSSAATGTFAVLDGPIRDAWGSAGGSAGTLGWPAGDQAEVPGGYRQAFQHGTLYAGSSGAKGTISGEILNYWSAGSNASRLGHPLGSASPWGAGGITGLLQEFERGIVMSSAITGTHAVLHGPIRDEWGSRGGSGGSLGWPTGDQAVVDGKIRQQFQHGAVTYGENISGAIADYLASGSNASKLGSAKGAAQSWTAGGVTGTLQYFLRGMVISSAATGTYAVLDGPIRDAWGGTGGSGGSLGWPVGDQRETSSGLRQEFQRGSILVTTGRSAVVLSGAIADYWATGANAGRLGAPISSPSSWTAGGVTGTLQYFAKGMVLSSAATGTYAVLDGQVRDAWGNAGGSGGALGWPTGEPESMVGGIRQQFQHGAVMVATGGSGFAVSGPVMSYWGSGPNAGFLGLPTSAANTTTARGLTGVVQTFQRGVVLSTNETGTHAIFTGQIRNVWNSQGGVSGPLGWPTSEQEVVSGLTRQQFQSGTITIAADGSAILLTGAFHTYWATGTNSTIIGSPTAPPVAWAAKGVAGAYQVFDKAMVLSSAQTGTYAVLDGPIRDAWGASGGSGGPLGWPVADQKPAPEGMRQQFQYGWVVVPTSGAPYIEMK
jgi:uncharacterized protein with LGFP repeats